MKEKELNTYDSKEYMLKTYFIINNRKLFSTDNFNFEDNLKNCFYIKKLGGNVHPTIYLDTKIDNKWVNKNQVIENYNALMDFVIANENSYICVRGFSRANIRHFIKMINELKGVNIKPVKFKSKLSEAQYERHLLTKEQRIYDLNQKLDVNGEIESAHQYMKMANSVFSKGKHKSRVKIIQLRKKIIRDFKATITKNAIF